MKIYFILLSITIYTAITIDQHKEYKWAPIGRLKQPYIVFINDIFNPTWFSKHQMTKEDLTRKIFLPKNINLSINCGICITKNFLVNSFSLSKLYLRPNDTVFDDEQIHSFRFDTALNTCVVINKITKNTTSAHVGSTGEIFCQFNSKHYSKLQFEIVEPHVLIFNNSLYHPCPQNFNTNFTKISKILENIYNHSETNQLLLDNHRQKDCTIYSFLQKEVRVYNFRYELNGDSEKNNGIDIKFFNPFIALVITSILNL